MQHSVLFPTFKHAHQDKNKLISGNHRSNFERAPSGFGGKDYTDSSRPVKKTNQTKKHAHSWIFSSYTDLSPSFLQWGGIHKICLCVKIPV